MTVIRGLAPMPSAAELRRRLEERERRDRQQRRPAPTLVPVPVVTPAPVVQLPVRLTIPWSVLVSDNRKYGVLGNRMILTPEYRAAKHAIRARAKALVGAARPLAVPLQLHASVYLPDRRAHDVANFGKCVHDALETVVYELDRWLKDVRWHEAGVDVDAPRAEVTITPL